MVQNVLKKHADLTFLRCCVSDDVESVSDIGRRTDVFDYLFPSTRQQSCASMLSGVRVAGGVLRSASIRVLPVARCGGNSPIPRTAASSCPFSSGADSTRTTSADADNSNANRIRLSRLVASYGTNMQMSRRSAERMIIDGMVTVAGDVVVDPSELLSIEEALGTIKVGGRQLRLPSSPPTSTSSSSLSSGDRTAEGSGSRLDRSDTGPKHKLQNHRTRIWLAHKLPGELVAENDPYGRPSLLDRLRRGGVGKPKKKSQSRVHLKPVGRLDMMTEGLLILTNDGSYARELELPSNKFHRTYRARVHGRLTEPKMRAIRSGVTIDNTRYGGMDVSIEKSSARREQSINTWLRITCCEGKNRQIRKVLESLGLKVTRLIRTQYGDYSLNTIPPGMAIEVPVKELDTQKKKGHVVSPARKNKRRQNAKASNGTNASDDRATVEWVRHA